MSQTYDVIVAGVGSMGSASCFHMARRGLRVLGLERFSIPHGMGSHHGYSRVIRKAYFEHPDYVRLLMRAYELYDELELLSGQKMLFRTRGLYMGLPDGEAVGGTNRAAIEHNLPVEHLTHAQLAQRFPQFRLPSDHVGLMEPDAGFLIPEKTVSAHCDQALRHGAELHGHEAVTGWEANGKGVRVYTDKGEYRARSLVFCGGAWSDRLVRDLGVPLKVTRQVWGWVWPLKPELFELGRLPIWDMDMPSGGQQYGVPITPDNPGFKIAYHFAATETDPDNISRDVLPGDEETFRPFIKKHLPDADGPLLALRACIYTSSPDKHFIIDTHPIHPNVSIACGFSGHGFKFTSVVGQIMADLAQNGSTPLPIGFLSLKRFGNKTATST